MGSMISNPIKASIKSSVNDEQVMKPLRQQGVILAKECVSDEQLMKPLRQQGVIFTRELSQDKGIVQQGALVVRGGMEGVETKLGLAVNILGIGVLLYAVNTLKRLFEKPPPPPPSATEAAASAAAAAASAEVARDAAAIVVFYANAVPRPPTQTARDS